MSNNIRILSILAVLLSIAALFAVSSAQVEEYVANETANTTDVVTTNVVNATSAATNTSAGISIVQHLLPELGIQSNLSTTEIIKGGEYRATILYEDPTAFQDVTEIGFYYPCQSQSSCGALYRLFDGEDTSGSSVVFDTRYNSSDTSSDFGLWLNVPANLKDPSFRPWGGLYHSEASMNCDLVPHILIYTLPLPKETMYLCLFEDWCQGGDMDYNEFIILLDPVPTP